VFSGGKNKEENKKTLQQKIKKYFPQNEKKRKQRNNERSETHPPSLVPNDDDFCQTCEEQISRATKLKTTAPTRMSPIHSKAHPTMFMALCEFPFISPTRGKKAATFSKCSASLISLSVCVFVVHTLFFLCVAAFFCLLPSLFPPISPPPSLHTLHKVPEHFHHFTFFC
jgi:hypothetical protein